VVALRNERGPFRNRQELLNVPRLGPKAFQQCAGFLRIRDGDNPLDASAVHPEHYGVVDAMARDLGCSVAELVGTPERASRIDLSKYVNDTVGLPTLNDILAELAKPGRDPRERFEPFAFAEGVHVIEDLKPGMKLPGIVTNVTRFGAFVDVGVHQDGLVHISRLSNGYVRDPGDVVKVHQRVMVTVVEVDLERRRIALSMKEDAHPARPKAARPARPEPAPSPPPAPAAPKPEDRRSTPDRRRPDRPKAERPRDDRPKPQPAEEPRGRNNPFYDLSQDLKRREGGKGA
jgi:uncharacterized protein